MRGRAVLERVEVRLDRGQVDFVLGGALNKHCVVVHALRPAENLLAAHEEVVRVCVARQRWIWHCVEGTHCERKLVERIKVGRVALADEPAEQLLLLRADVVVVAELGVSSCTQHFNCLAVAQHECLGQIQKLL